MDSASFCSPEQLTVSGSFSWSTNRATLLLVFQLQSTIVAEIVLESFAELRRCTTHFANPPVLAAKLSPCGVLEFFRVALIHSSPPTQVARRYPERWRSKCKLSDERAVFDVSMAYLWMHVNSVLFRSLHVVSEQAHFDLSGTGFLRVGVFPVDNLRASHAQYENAVQRNLAIVNQIAHDRVGHSQ